MKTNLKTRNKKGFTLAEVLVTLAIIGVIAALTVPTLIQSIQKSQYESALKKNYSVIAQAYKSLDADGITASSVFPGADYGKTALDTLAPKLSILKNCGFGFGCLYYSPLSYLKGIVNIPDLETGWAGAGGKAILADGSMIIIFDNKSNCTTSPGTGPLLNSVCGYIMIDVNGVKAPNKWGRDYFAFWVTKAGIYPWGSNGDWYANDCTIAGNGWGCAHKVLIQGMNY